MRESEGEAARPNCDPNRAGKLCRAADAAFADAGLIAGVTGHQDDSRLGLTDGLDLRRAAGVKPPRRDHARQCQRHEGTGYGKVATTGTP